MSLRLLNALDEVKNFPEITLGRIVDNIKEEALLIVCIISILPFMQPIPIPGVSSVVGLIVIFQGFSLIFYQKPILTRRMRDMVISKQNFEFIYKAAVKFSNVTSKISAFKHPVTHTRVVQILSGIAIVLSAVFLSLPLPIPFSNLVPALSIFLICIGLLEEDAVLVLMGYGITLSVLWMILFSYHIIREQFLSWL